MASEMVPIWLTCHRRRANQVAESKAARYNKWPVESLASKEEYRMQDECSGSDATAGANLEEERGARLLLDRHLDSLRVGHQQVVADNLPTSGAVVRNPYARAHRKEFLFVTKKTQKHHWMHARQPSCIACARKKSSDLDTWVAAMTALNLV